MDEDVEVEPTDLEADLDADADVEIDEGPSNSSNRDPATNGTSASALLHREDAEMSDGSISNAVHTTRSSPGTPAPVTVGGTGAGAGGSNSSTTHTTRLIPITECELRPSMERDREAGGETEVEPDSVGQLSLSSRRAARGAGGAGGSRTRFVSPATAAAGGGGACTEDEGMMGGTGSLSVEEVDEVEMGDAVE